MMEKELCGEQDVVANQELDRPLSGIIMAPLVGALADKSKSRWGRRRPFMVGGSVVVALCLLTLGWAKEIVQSLVGNTTFVSQTVIRLCGLR